jgi:hypothetical protein
MWKKFLKWLGETLLKAAVERGADELKKKAR